MSSGSFTFCGTDIESLGLEYAPDISETFVYRPAESQSYIETFDAHNGGYYYGSHLDPKEFTLRCIFEEKNIDQGIMAKVYSLFKVGKTGKLVFSRRPWCYYYATVTDPIQTEYTNYLNGIITITLKAMYPYARSDIFTVLRGDKNYDMMLANTAVFNKPDMELPYKYKVTENSSIILCNPGAERAALGFYISGDVGDGVIIKNTATGQECMMVKITNENTTNENKRVFVDSINGKTLIVSENKKEYGFKFHDHGFLELEPAFPATRNLLIENVVANTVTVSNILNQSLIGQYVFLDGTWRKITQQPDKHTIILDTPIILNERINTMAVTMNEIKITPVTTMNIEIEFVFKPTYA